MSMMNNDRGAVGWGEVDLTVDEIGQVTMGVSRYRVAIDRKRRMREMSSSLSPVPEAGPSMKQDQIQGGPPPLIPSIAFETIHNESQSNSTSSDRALKNDSTPSKKVKLMSNEVVGESTRPDCLKKSTNAGHVLGGKFCAIGLFHQFGSCACSGNDSSGKSFG